MADAQRVRYISFVLMLFAASVYSNNDGPTATMLRGDVTPTREEANQNRTLCATRNDSSHPCNHKQANAITKLLNMCHLFGACEGVKTLRRHQKDDEVQPHHKWSNKPGKPSRPHVINKVIVRITKEWIQRGYFNVRPVGKKKKQLLSKGDSLDAEKKRTASSKKAHPKTKSPQAEKKVNIRGTKQVSHETPFTLRPSSAMEHLPEHSKDNNEKVKENQK